ncbi:MAG TPA: hypothetical protein ENJ27_00985 [Candidatus Moranbacteria bacterium]|nr:hypothetical protein [Candidatus Moranbacteria bacterium]
MKIKLTDEIRIIKKDRNLILQTLQKTKKGSYWKIFGYYGDLTSLALEYLEILENKTIINGFTELIETIKKAEKNIIKKFDK